MNKLLLAAALAATVGCGDSGSGTCGFVEELLPYEVGYSWTYAVTDLDTGERRTKVQRIESAPDDPDYGPVVLQITEKTTGRTESLLRKEGGRVLRFEQRDLDTSGVLERTIVYEPPRIRIDESDDRIAAGAMFSETYTETTIDNLGEVSVDVVDEWEVVDTAAACEAPIGSFDCLQLRRLRTQGGNSDKTFFFARGVGKVREVGTSTIEDLVACE